ncbi:MAG: response regulator [Chloroflexi bacterium]|nr:response regulator [Chloroflexota bacterium]
MSHTKRQALLLDDDLATVQILTAGLTDAGLEVLLASSVEDAIHVASSEIPDIVIADVFAPEMKGIGLRQKLRQIDSTRHIPVLLLVDMAYEDRVCSILEGSFEYVTKPFDPSKAIEYVKSFISNLPYEMDVSAMTKLPGSRWLEHELLTRMVQRRCFALLNIDINSLRPFRRIYGAQRADYAVRLLARILRETVRLCGNEDDFVGHVGEDDFYLISSPEKSQALCQGIVTKFDHSVINLYTQKDALRGYVECEYPLGYTGRYPIMTLSIGVTMSENRQAADMVAMRREASDVREFAKSISESTYYFNRRRGDLILEPSLARAGRHGRAMLFGRGAARAHQDPADFAYFVTNQLRVPATLVQSTLDYLIQTAQLNLTAEQQQHLIVLQRHAHHLSDSISQLAVFHDLRQGGAIMRLETVDLADVLKQVAESVQGAAREKGIQLEINGADHIGRIVVDERKLCQILTYTLFAIAEYSVRGASIKMDVAETDSQVRLTLVVDNLCLSRRELARSFRGFYRPKKTPTPNHGSLGLGFHLARQLLGAIGGTMSIRYRERFNIQLDFPKAWQSVDERARVVQARVADTREATFAEIGRIEAMFTAQGEIPTELRKALASVEMMVEHLSVEAGRAISLADEMSSRLQREHERAAALDAGFVGTLEAIVDLTEHRHWQFADHSRRVAAEAFSIGQLMGLPEYDLQMLYYAALLHDLGMAAVPEEILAKPADLSDDELSLLRRHPINGSRSISTVRALASLVQPVIHHHERYDGTGYPLGLAGASIPIAARILAVSDAYDAMISGRPYRPPLQPGLAIKNIEDAAGKQFDPEVVNAFLKLHEGERTAAAN